ncbi:MAG: NPCBM/NEW2 domain-containing protein [Pirellulales bacterium]
MLIALILFAAVGRQCRAEGGAAEREQAAAAQKILYAWRKSQAKPTDRFLHVICWTPADRGFPSEFHDRLGRMLPHIREFYSKEMERHGFGKCSFNLKRRDDGQIVLIEVHGRHPANHYGKQSGGEIRHECLPALEQAGIDPDEETIAIFCNLAEWNEEELRFAHNSPYYAYGTYRHGTAWQVDSPELDTLNLSKTAPVLSDGEYGRISLGKHNSIFIGGIAHELGHALGLPHCEARPDERSRGTALMGAGNRTYGDEIRGDGRGTFLTFAHALRLASHPQFAACLETRKNKSDSSLIDLDIRADGTAIAVSGTIAGEPPIYGVVAYFDPEGHGDYNQTTATAVPDNNGRFSLRSDAFPWGKRGALHLVALHANGALDDESARAKMRYSYRIAADGACDLRSTRTRLALAPIVVALERGDAELARRLASELDDKDAAAIAAVLLDPAAPTKTPAEYQGKSSIQSLTAFRADSAAVGWARPTFNRVPEASLLLESAGDIFETGIYAHAPARYEYSLAGKWDVIQGKVGIAMGHFGSVQFEVQGDGRRLWQSPTVLADQIVPFKVDVKGVDRLELLTSPTDDGRSNDWGLWLVPRLLRSE